MAIFGVRPWVNPLGKMSIFRLFGLFVFIALKGVFQFYNIVKHLFLAYSAKKKKLEKWPFLDQNHGLSALGKCQFFYCLNVLFLQPRKAFFRSRISKKIFFSSMLPKKKKVKKMIIFAQKPWLNPFGKMSVFRLFERLVFIALKGAFSL